MKILRHGTLPCDQSLRGACSHCGAEVEFTPNEANVSFDNRYGELFSVKCPTPGCDSPIYGSGKL